MGRILIIDDETITRQAMEALLSRAGHEVRGAADGPAGIEAYRKSRPDLVLLDRNLPKMRGSEVLRALLDIDERANVLVLTGHADPEGEDKYLELGACAFLSKDTSISHLIRIVERAIGRIDGSTGFPRSVGPEILVVDDDPSVRRMLKRFLERKGYSMATAADGREALALLRSTHPRIILLDIVMPGMDGLAILREVHRINHKVAVMIITAQEDLEIARECMRAGAYDYIVKPVNFEYLETSLWSKLLSLDP